MCWLTQKIGERSEDGLHQRTGAVWKVINASVHWGTAARSTLKVRFYFDRTDLLSLGVVKLQDHLKLYQWIYSIAHTMFYSCCLCLLKVGPNLKFIYFFYVPLKNILVKEGLNIKCPERCLSWIESCGSNYNVNLQLLYHTKHFGIYLIMALVHSFLNFVLVRAWKTRLDITFTAPNGSQAELSYRCWTQCCL